MSDGTPTASTFPAGAEESLLVGKFFEEVTKLQPDLPMGDRTDIAMRMLAVVKKWAHAEDLTTGEEWENPTSRIVRVMDTDTIN